MHVRPLLPADLPRLVEIWNQVDGEPMSVETLAHYERVAPDTIRHRLVAEDEEGAIVGFAVVARLPRPASPFAFRLGVDIPHRRRGSGHLLVQSMSEWIASVGGGEVRAYPNESHHETVSFALKRGFREIERYTDSRLDLEVVEAGPLVPIDGIEIVSVASLQHAAGDWLHRFTRSLSLTSDTWETTDRETFEAKLRGSPHAFVAFDGEHAVGIASLQPHGAGLSHALTAVSPDHRRRGIALALKQACIESARRAGAPYILTSNAVDNEAILAVNRRLGFRPVRTNVTLARTVAGAAS